MASDDDTGTRIPDAAVAVLGVLGAICMGSLLAPQAWKNWKRQSTEGMSVGLIVWWHIATILATGYYAADPADDSVAWVIASLAFLALLSCLVEAQVLAYRRGNGMREKGSGDEVGPGTSSSDLLRPSSPVFIPLASAALIVITGVLVGAFVLIFRAIPEGATYAIGNVMPTALLVIAFFPQYREFIVRWSTEGYSFGVTVIDCTGCLSNALVIVAPKSLTVSEALKEAAPFLACVAAHVVLVAIALFVKFNPRAAREAPTGAAADPSSAPGSAELAATKSDSAAAAAAAPAGGEDTFPAKDDRPARGPSPDSAPGKAREDRSGEQCCAGWLRPPWLRAKGQRQLAFSVV